MPHPIRTALLTLAVCLIACVASSCHRSAPDEAATVAVDSLANAHKDLFFSAPRSADSLLAATQRQATDSAAWWRLQLYRGMAHVQMGDSTGAERLYAQVEAWCQSHPGNEVLEGMMWNKRGVAADIFGDIPAAMRFYERSYNVLSQGTRRDKEFIPTAVNLADLYQQQGHMPRAAACYREALFVCDSLHTDKSRVNIYGGLALIYADLSDFAQAHHYYRLARPYIDGETPFTQFYYHTGLGNCHYFEQRYADALADFGRARGIALRYGWKAMEFMCENNMLEVELMRGNLPGAEGHYRRAEALAASTNDINAAALFYFRSLKADLAIAQRRMPIDRQVLAIGSDTTSFRSHRYLMLHYRRLQHFAALHADWRQAYALQTEADRYADSLRGIQSAHHVEEMRLQFERDTTLLHQRLALADYGTRVARQQTLVMAIVSVSLAVLMAIAVGVWFYRRHTRRRMERQMERITGLRMDIVRNRVSPHYIFNVLNTVLPRLSGHADVNVPIGLLIDVLRGNLLTSGRVAVPLHDELQLVRHFVALHSLTKGQWPRVVWHVPEALEQSTMAVPSMSLQIPVENALKHAFPVPSAESLISVSVDYDQAERYLHLRVTDNGRGYNPGLVRRTGRDTGTGLKLLTRTFEILNRRNARPASFTITNLDAPAHGTEMHLAIPDDYDFGEDLG